MKKISEVELLLYLPIIVRQKAYQLFGTRELRSILEKKEYQRENFTKLAVLYESKYRQSSKYPLGKYVTQTWTDFNNRMKTALLPVPKFNFLNDPFIIFSMFMTKGGRLMKDQLAYIEKAFGKKTCKDVLEEDAVGEPLIMNKKYLTSHNRVNMLYHLARFQKTTGKKISNFNSIVEWGSGYGGLVAIIKRLRSPKPLTYVCIDTPLILCLQWLYLGSIFGPKNVVVLFKPNDKIVKNKINLIPVSLLKKISFKTELFISTWALSESSKKSHETVAAVKWFGAKHILIGYQKNSSAFEGPERVGKLVTLSQGKIEPVGLFPNNYYAFK